MPRANPSLHRHTRRKNFVKFMWRDIRNALKINDLRAELRTAKAYLAARPYFYLIVTRALAKLAHRFSVEWLDHWGENIYLLDSDMQMISDRKKARGIVVAYSSARFLFITFIE